MPYACASSVIPMNIVIASAAIATRVDAAFRLSGGRNAGTPFDTASTPVIAVQPFENAVSKANVVSAPAPLAPMQRRLGGGAIAPVKYRHAPTASIAEDADDEEVGRYGEDAPGLAHAAQVADHQDADERRVHLDAVGRAVREMRT